MKEKAGKIIGILVVVIGAYITLRSGNKLHDSLVKNSYFTTGYIKEGNVKSPASSRVTFTFTYTYKGKEYQNYSYPYDFTDNNNWSVKFIGKTFTVVIDTSNPANSDMLLTKEKFKEFSLAYPDSLKQFSQYLKGM